MLTAQTPITRAQLEAALAYHRTHRLLSMFPDRGPYARAGYAKHLEFFAAGATHRERGFVAGNRCGKTESGAYEVSLHLTGQYPEWWKGKRFQTPIEAWAAGKTGKTVRDILQAKLLGKIARGDDNDNDVLGLGTGMIPADCILSTQPHTGLPNAIESARIRHVSGGISTLTFKSWEQGRDAFAGTERHVVWYDEEPDEACYVEGAMRTMATGQFPGGIVILTMTPLDGWTTVVMKFMDEGQRKDGNRYVVQAGWDHAPHLSAQEKADLLRMIPPYQRDARSKGIPQLGRGAIFPVEESKIIVAPFAIPRHWPRYYGLDVGTKTAAIWGALDRETLTTYLYSEYFREGAEPGVHAQAIKSRGAWIPGVVDPAARGRSQIDGRQLLQMYRDLGLTLIEADNAVEAGIQSMWEAMVSGQLKVFATLQEWLTEFRRYRRDDKGRVVKQDDHLIDASRYGWMSGRARAITEPVKRLPMTPFTPTSDRGWMG